MSQKFKYGDLVELIGINEMVIPKKVIVLDISMNMTTDSIVPFEETVKMYSFKPNTEYRVIGNSINTIEVIIDDDSLSVDPSLFKLSAKYKNFLNALSSISTEGEIE